MTIRLKTKVSFRTVVSLLVVMCIYIRSGSPFSLTYQSTTLLLHILMTGIIIVYSFLHKPRERVSSRLFLFLVLFCVSVLGTMLNTNETALYKNYVIQVLMCVDAILIVRLIGVEKTIRYWILSMRAIVLAALILYSFINIGVKIFPIIETNASTYYTIFIASQLTTANRISGSFWEPSMFVVFLSITLLFELLLKERSVRKNRFWIIMEILTLILTVSASAIVSLTFISFIYYYNQSKRMKTRNIFAVLILLICLLFAIFCEEIIMLMYKAFPSMLYKFVEKDVSFLTRVNNPIGDMLVCINNPFGVGIQNVENVVRQYATLYTGDVRAVISRTSTWSYYFAAFGWVGGISVNLIWIIGICKSRWLEGAQKLAFLVFLLYLLTSVTLVSNQLYWILLVLIYLASQRTQLSALTLVE